MMSTLTPNPRPDPFFLTNHPLSFDSRPAPFHPPPFTNAPYAASRPQNRFLDYLPPANPPQQPNGISSFFPPNIPAPTQLLSKGVPLAPQVSNARGTASPTPPPSFELSRAGSGSGSGNGSIGTGSGADFASEPVDTFWGPGTKTNIGDGNIGGEGFPIFGGGSSSGGSGLGMAEGYTNLRTGDAVPPIGFSRGFHRKSKSMHPSSTAFSPPGSNLYSPPPINGYTQPTANTVGDGVESFSFDNSSFTYPSSVPSNFDPRPQPGNIPAFHRPFQSFSIQSSYQQPEPTPSYTALALPGITNHFYSAQRSRHDSAPVHSILPPHNGYTGDGSSSGNGMVGMASPIGANSNTPSHWVNGFHNGGFPIENQDEGRQMGGSIRERRTQLRKANVHVPRKSLGGTSSKSDGMDDFAKSFGGNDSSDDDDILGMEIEQEDSSIPFPSSLASNGQINASNTCLSPINGDFSPGSDPLYALPPIQVVNKPKARPKPTHKRNSSKASISIKSPSKGGKASTKASAIVAPPETPSKTRGGRQSFSSQGRERSDSDASDHSASGMFVRSGRGPKVKIPNPIPDYTIQKKTRGRFTQTDPSQVDAAVVHVCPVPGCGACFKRREHVKRHIRGIHTNDKPFICKTPGCPSVFSRPDNLKTHYINVHHTSYEAIEALYGSHSTKY